VSFGYAMGYGSIVLVGVDLYDRRYFWLGEDETRPEDLARDAAHTDVHNTARPVVDLMRQWTEFLKERGVSLTVYNPQSLLAEVMDVYSARGAQPHIIQAARKLRRGNVKLRDESHLDAHQGRKKS
tara:strand:- start:39 stop:416 length:378 start_codon:yes stop_codon:yes gene_type:complete